MSTKSKNSTNKTVDEARDEGKLAALASAEELISQDVEQNTSEETTQTDLIPGIDGKAPETVAQANRKTNKAVKRADDNKLDKDIVADDKDIISTQGNVNLTDTEIDDGSSTPAVEMQYADGTVSDEDIATVAEQRAADKSRQVNSLDFNNNSESVDNEVKVNSAIATATNFDVDKNPQYRKSQDLEAARENGLGNKGIVSLQALDEPRGLAETNSSTEHLQLDEIAVPNENRRAPSAMEERVRRQASQNHNTLLNSNNSSESLISRTRRINVFQAVAEAKTTSEQETKRYLTGNITSMRQHLSQELGLNIESLDAGSFLGSVVDSLNDYVKAMDPRSPKNAGEVSLNQGNFINTIKTILEQKDTATGVMGLNILEEYCKIYRTGAMRGELPLRAFNEFSGEDNRLTNLIYTIQGIAKDGREKALSNISIKKLKESVDSVDGQHVIVSYLNQ